MCRPRDIGLNLRLRGNWHKPCFLNTLSILTAQLLKQITMGYRIQNRPNINALKEVFSMWAYFQAIRVSCSEHITYTEGLFKRGLHYNSTRV